MSFWGSAYSEDTNIEKTIDQADQRLYVAKNWLEKSCVGRCVNQINNNATGQKEILSVLESRFGFASEAIRHF